MRFSLITFMALILTGCDQPQRNRLPNHVIPGSTNPVSTNSSWGNPFSNGNTGTTQSGGPSSATGGTKPPGFENCDLSHRYYATNIGHMGICQSALDEKVIAVSSSISDNNRTCLIPTYKESSGSSTYLGQPQCYQPQVNQVMNGTLYRTRTSYNHLPLNAVMVMKESSLSAYFTCMDAYSNFPQSICPQGPQSNPNCQQLFTNCPNGPQSNNYCHSVAQQNMTTKCEDFKATHSYIDIRLK